MKSFTEHFSKYDTNVTSLCTARCPPVLQELIFKLDTFTKKQWLLYVMFSLKYRAKLASHNVKKLVSKR